MCRYISGNMCVLGGHCHCHPARDHQGYDDGYMSEQRDDVDVSSQIKEEYNKE